MRMLGDIKTKEINTVIVKDLSRFGRDLEEVSKYLEKIFPFMQVRFISVNDNYDSISPECDKRFNGEYFETFQKYLNREQSKIVQLNKRNEARRFELYEQYVSGEIDTDAYNRI